jgi:hypothetical protein
MPELVRPKPMGGRDAGPLQQANVTSSRYGCRLGVADNSAAGVGIEAGSYGCSDEQGCGYRLAGVEKPG